MKHRIIFAMGNEGKMRKIRMILADLGLEILSMKEAGADPDIVEDGTTFAKNARIKAMAVWKCAGDIVLADDSGLVVDYLGERGCIPPDIWGRIRPMRSRIGLLSTD